MGIFFSRIVLDRTVPVTWVTILVYSFYVLVNRITITIRITVGKPDKPISGIACFNVLLYIIIIHTYIYKVTRVDIEDSYIIYKILEVYIIPPKLINFPTKFYHFLFNFPSRISHCSLSLFGGTNPISYTTVHIVPRID